MAAITEFVERHRPAWDELTNLLLRAGSGGVGALGPNDLKKLGPLYRRASADLAYVRLRGGDERLIVFLNDLVTRAHGLLYAERGPGGARLLRFFAAGFPALLRARAFPILLAGIVFVAGCLVSAGFSLADPNNIAVFVGGRADDLSNFYRDMPQTIADSDRPLMSTMLMTNNIRVAVIAFALGMLGGLPALLPILLTGLQVGAIIVQQHGAGHGLVIWSFLLPHGVLELPAIFIAAGAGMMLGHALVAPGELSRADALKVAAADALRLVIGAAGLLVVAGLIEAFISPTGLPPAVKLIFAGLTALGFAAYVRHDPNPARTNP